MTESTPLVLAEPEAPFWGFGELFLMAATFLMALIVIGGAAAGLLRENAESGLWQVLEEMAAYLVLFFALKIVFFIAQRPLFRSLGWVPHPFSARALAGVGFFLFLLSVLLQIVLRTPEVQTPFEKLLASGAASRVAIALFGVTLGPTIEELLFRGFLQPVLVSKAGVFPGILITSALFGAMHLSQNADLWQSGVLITVAGFGFGVVRHVTGSTRASTISHIAYNSIPFLATLLQPAHS